LRNLRKIPESKASEEGLKLARVCIAVLAINTDVVLQRQIGHAQLEQIAEWNDSSDDVVVQD